MVAVLGEAGCAGSQKAGGVADPLLGAPHGRRAALRDARHSAATFPLNGVEPVQNSELATMPAARNRAGFQNHRFQVSPADGGKG
ncbi:hypothetical protein SAMN05428944_7525 [Streptomyces sp. 1222.5]|nr:hypothetical protein BX260_0565 [Streptomyces sp. 5112.2]SED39138.1 hypothetical protein SAMN05428944_7525 [Streptomyces sp. 1222.5]